MAEDDYYGGRSGASDRVPRRRGEPEPWQPEPRDPWGRADDRRGDGRSAQDRYPQERYPQERYPQDGAEGRGGSRRGERMPWDDAGQTDSWRPGADDTEAWSGGEGRGNRHGRDGGGRAAAGARAPGGRGSGHKPAKAGPTPLVRAGRGLAAAATSVLMLVTGFVWYANHDLTTGLHTSSSLSAIKPGDQGYVAPHLGSDMNLLLIGLDSRKDMNGNDLPTQFVEQDLHAGSSSIGGYNTNVLILMHIPANGGQVTAYSIPRDDYVERPGGTSSVPGVGTIPDLGMGKIKEAYGTAKSIAEGRLAGTIKDKAQLEQMSRDVGREATLRAVQLLTGVHVDHFAEINLKGFYDIVSAIGNIQVCLKAPANDPIENGAGTGINLPAGLQSIDAATALQFVRQRYHLANGDLDRTHRQQAFLTSVTHKLKANGILGDLGKMQALFNVVKSDVVIDNGLNPIDFAQQASNLTGGNTTFYTLPILRTANVPDGSGVPGQTTSVNMVDPAALKNIVTTAFNNDAAVAPPPTTAATSSAPPPATSTPTPKANVEVLNGTSITGFASQVSGYLFSQGIAVTKTGNGGNIYHTVIRYGAGAQSAAQDVATKLGTKAVPQSSSSLAANTVVVTIGGDYKIPATQQSSGGSSGGAPSDPTTSSGGLSNGGAVTAANSIDGIPCVY